LLLLEPLDLLFDLLQVNLCPTVLRLLVLIPGRCEETALLEKGLEARRQPLSHTKQVWYSEHGR